MQMSNCSNSATTATATTTTASETTASQEASEFSTEAPSVARSYTISHHSNQNHHRGRYSVPTTPTPMDKQNYGVMRRAMPAHVVAAQGSSSQQIAPVEHRRNA